MNKVPMDLKFWVMGNSSTVTKCKKKKITTVKICITLSNELTLYT